MERGMKLTLFSKKKIYKVVWQFMTLHTEYIKAHDIADAWKKITKNHPMPITCISIEEVDK
jgi:hypothetical protein